MLQPLLPSQYHPDKSNFALTPKTQRLKRLKFSPQGISCTFCQKVGGLTFVSCEPNIRNYPTAQFSTRTFTILKDQMSIVTSLFFQRSHTPQQYVKITPQQLMTGHFWNTPFFWGGSVDFLRVRCLPFIDFDLAPDFRSQETALDFASRSSCKSLASTWVGSSHDLDTWLIGRLVIVFVP